MRHRPRDPVPPPEVADPVVASARGSASGLRLRHGPRSVIVTERRVVVFDAHQPVADLPRAVVDATWTPPNELAVALAGERWSLRVPDEEREHAEEVLAALDHEPFVAALDAVDLPHRTRRALDLDGYDGCALVLTRERLLLLARRQIRTDVALSCPRAAARVRVHETVWPGGDLLFDRLVIEVDGKPLELDVDQRWHGRACALVTALGGTSVPAAPRRTTRKADP